MNTLKKLNKLPYMKYKLHLDISKAGRLHWHGWIMWEDNGEIFNFFLYCIHRLLQWSKIEIDKINDDKKWTTYCRKIDHLKKLVINQSTELEEVEDTKGITKYYNK